MNKLSVAFGGVGSVPAYSCARERNVPNSKRTQRAGWRVWVMDDDHGLLSVCARPFASRSDAERAMQALIKANKATVADLVPMGQLGIDQIMYEALAW